MKMHYDDGGVVACGHPCWIEPLQVTTDKLKTTCLLCCRKIRTWIREDDAKKLRTKGHKLSKIADALGVSIPTASRLCR